MKRLGRSWWLLAAVGMLALPAISLAQPRMSRSSRPYVPIAPEGDLEQLLKDNLQQVRGMQQMKDIFDLFIKNPDRFVKTMTPEQLQRLREMGKNIDFNDPRTKKAIGEALNKPGVEDAIKKNLPTQAIEDAKKFIEKHTAPPDNPNKSGPSPDTQPPSPRSTPDVVRSDPERDVMRTLRDWLERLENSDEVGDLFRDSPAIQGAIEDLTRALLNQKGGGFDWNAAGLLDHFGNMGDVLDTGLSGIGRLPMPSLPRFNMPRFSLGGMPSLGMPRLATPGPGGGSGLGYVFLWLAVLLTLGLVFWQLRGRVAGPGRRARGTQPWRLGPWPVHPARVASRAEVIQAFEYLSLLLLGPAARTWNHRDIAAGISGEAEPQREAARRLAALYEEARYAPGNEPLAGTALAEARRDLCLLGGVAGA